MNCVLMLMLDDDLDLHSAIEYSLPLHLSKVQLGTYLGQLHFRFERNVPNLRASVSEGSSLNDSKEWKWVLKKEIIS